MKLPNKGQGRNHGKNLGATSAMVGRICPPGCNRNKVSQNLGATAVAPVAPVVTSLNTNVNPWFLRSFFVLIQQNKASDNKFRDFELLKRWSAIKIRR